MNTNDVIKGFIADPMPTRKSGGAVTASNGVLLSYAMIIAKVSGDKFLVRKRGPSVTTNKHLGMVRRAIPANLQIEVEEI